ncbi:MAG TPA: aminotransferase class I/II-fold pyridoxal phosphate-dependent enzyme, partial [Anaerolineae bacterium]
MRAEYLARRDLVVEALDAIPGFACPVPTGAFYAMPEISGLGVTDTRAFAKMLLEAGVAVLPGTDFGSHGEGYLRISYGTAREKLVEGINRIRVASERWQQNQT